MLKNRSTQAKFPKSKRHKARLMALAGAWKGRGTESFKGDAYRWRHEAPASKPAQL